MTPLTLKQRAIHTVRQRRTSQPDIGAADRSEEGRGRTALVTGASSGIGWAMAELLAAKGYDVVVVARRGKLLEELKAVLEPRWNVRVHPLPCDLSTPTAVAEILEDLRLNNLTIDFLVNNAGFSMDGEYLDYSWDRHEQFLRVMCLSVAELTHQLLPHMVEQRWGRILNVTSIGAYFPGAARMALYIASKTFVQRLTEALHSEYADSNVLCSACAPGTTETGIFEAGGITDYWDNSLLAQMTMMRPERVARDGYRTCMAGRRSVVPGFKYKCFTFATQHTPPVIRFALVSFLSRMSPTPDVAPPSSVNGAASDGR